jgi:hypothetical protein
LPGLSACKAVLLLFTSPFSESSGSRAVSSAGDGGHINADNNLAHFYRIFFLNFF